MKKFLLIFHLLLICPSVAFATGQPVPWQLGLQKPASPIMEELYHFHDFLIIVGCAIVILVFCLLLYVMIRFNARANPVPMKFSHNLMVEVIWTTIPIIILIIIAIPSFRILKFYETVPKCDMTIKVVGSQWFWTYSYPDHGNFTFDSYMIQDEDLKPGQPRLLAVDNKIVVPQGAKIKFLITAADVMHSFAVPALGVKTDAVPGRTNETWTQINKQGIYYGQCSELCGVNHGFMPIAIKVVSQEEFDRWIKEAKQKFV